MQKVGLWQINGKAPVRLQECNADLDQQLESWIEADPDLLQIGLTIVGRQVEVEGGRIDLLALDPQGRWVIIEIKRGQVRRDSVMQVIEYAAYLSAMPVEELRRKVDGYFEGRSASLQSLLEEREAPEALEPETREIMLYIIGTGREHGLERLVSYLAERFQMPLFIAQYDVFRLPDGQQILVQEVAEAPLPKSATSEQRAPAIEQVCQVADREGIGPEFRELLKIASLFGLYPRTYRRSIMYTPPSNQTRMLFTVWARPARNKLKMYVSLKSFAEYFPISEEEATTLFGKNGWKEIDRTQVTQFIEAMTKLYQRNGLQRAKKA
jgi:hypothetical protein